ncbi:MAG TPA: hypothetical protein VGS41_13500, partial [Chthonomonadales bacterium]|nr:hypothetical protein [Chthonomonadales bacterium]
MWSCENGKPQSFKTTLRYLLCATCYLLQESGIFENPQEQPTRDVTSVDRQDKHWPDRMFQD